ncbi:stage V sporulation protein B [Caldibacillus debilis]|uniref:stage V sporulation protein B n=1 Tax=Caldibacillus debilis TaxID=301148 RepID=UPI000B568A1A|nr:stage V sporulation protein B [Caldibacillus debilis]OUM84193.1 MAG: stage V sporulation protein B [Caldibacillus debilis]
MSKFVKGTIILLAAGMMTRILGFINRVVIARSIGEEGVGLYMMTYPAFILAVTIIQLGIPVAVSKRIAEAEALGEHRKIKKIFALSLFITLALSFLVTPVLYFGAPYLTEALFTDQRALYPLQTIAPVLPIVAASSVIRGYFQGKQNMLPSALSQLIEQLVRIFLLLALTRLFVPYGPEYAASAAMLAIIGGEFLSCLYLAGLFKIKKAFQLRKNFFRSLKNSRAEFRELMAIALPATGSRLIGSVSWFIEPIVVTQSLALAGVSAVAATKQYGILTGLALPLLLLPSFITAALSTSLVPAISEAASLKNYYLAEYRIQQALKFCLITGAASVVIIFTLAEPLMAILYRSTSGTIFIQIMAPLFLFQYFQGPLLATLQALDAARAAMVNSLIGAVAKTLLIFLLASRPNIGINGVALAMATGTVLVTLLHLATILKIIPLSINLRFYGKVASLAVAAGIFGHLAYLYFLGETTPLFAILLSIAAIAAAYIFLLLATKTVYLKELTGWFRNFFFRH